MLYSAGNSWTTLHIVIYVTAVIQAASPGGWGAQHQVCVCKVWTQLISLYCTCSNSICVYREVWSSTKSSSWASYHHGCKFLKHSSEKWFDCTTRYFDWVAFFFFWKEIFFFFFSRKMAWLLQSDLGFYSLISWASKSFALCLCISDLWPLKIHPNHLTSQLNSFGFFSSSLFQLVWIKRSV